MAVVRVAVSRRDMSQPLPPNRGGVAGAGMRELDVLLERYLQERYPSAPAAEQQAFVALLERQTPSYSPM